MALCVTGSAGHASFLFGSFYKDIVCTFCVFHIASRKALRKACTNGKMLGQMHFCTGAVLLCLYTAISLY